MTISEKQPLLHKAEQSEIHTNTGRPLFLALLSNSFSCFPRLRQPQNEDIESSDDEIEVDAQLTIPIVTSDLSAGDKLYKLRQLMRQNGIAVYIVPSEDEHQSEYTALADKRREFISGFTGSAGVCVVTIDNKELDGKAILSTDGRYFLQAENQLDPAYWLLLKQGTAGYPTWYEFAVRSAAESSFSHVISCDARLISVATGEYFERAQRAQMGRVQFRPLVDENLVDAVWGDARPVRSARPVFVYGPAYAGEDVNSKVARVREKITKDYGATHLVVTSLDDVAWLLNLRAHDDVPFNPVFFSYVVVAMDEVVLYVAPEKLGSADASAQDSVQARSLRSHLASITGLRVRGYTDFYHDLSLMADTTSERVKLVLPNKSATSYAVVQALPRSGAKELVTFASVVSNMKIFKNKTELFNARVCQYKDSLAFVIFAAWLDRTLARGKRPVSEYAAGAKLYAVRARFANYMGLSYETILSTGPNAAIVHYAPDKYNSADIDVSTPYLIDSGGQYLEGTTDITRTFFFSENPKPEYIKYYTLVLKGHLAVAMAKFPSTAPAAATSAVLDGYARQALWNAGRDYNHGTGHGVASFGNVHEGPLYISAGLDPLGPPLFQKGAILTDEPGYYEADQFGIRVESELEIVECDAAFGKTRLGDNFLGFAYLTKVPFCRRLIDPRQLSPVEVDWINDFHRSIRIEFGPKLAEMGEIKAKQWLWKETEPL